MIKLTEEQQEKILRLLKVIYESYKIDLEEVNKLPCDETIEWRRRYYEKEIIQVKKSIDKIKNNPYIDFNDKSVSLICYFVLFGEDN